MNGTVCSQLFSYSCPRKQHKQDPENFPAGISRNIPAIPENSVFPFNISLTNGFISASLFCSANSSHFISAVIHDIPDRDLVNWFRLRYFPEGFGKDFLDCFPFHCIPPFGTHTPLVKSRADVILFNNGPDIFQRISLISSTISASQLFSTKREISSIRLSAFAL